MAVDYDKLATQFGGTSTQDEEEDKVDYDALATQLGGSAVEEQPPAPVEKQQPDIDYDSMAVQYGGTTAEKDVVELKPKEVTPITFKDLNKEENLQTIRSYAEARFGKEGKQQKGESNEDYIKRWMSAMRGTEWNTALNGVPELNWIYNASKEDAAKAAKAWQLYDTVPDWYEKGGQSGIEAAIDISKSIVTDPTNLVGLGIGAFAKQQAARAAIKLGIKEKLKYYGLGALAQAPIGAATSAVDQQIEIETGRREEISKGQIAASAALNALAGVAEVAGALGKAPKKTTKEDFAEVLKAKTVPKVTKEEKRFTEIWDKELEETLTEFDKFEGRQTLDKLSPPTDVTEAQVRKDLSLKAINVARYIIETDPGYRDALYRVANKEQKISDAVKDVFMSIEQRTKQGDIDVPKISDDIFEAALERAGINIKEFAEAARATVSDGATIMQGYSAAAKILRRTVEIDPKAQEIIDQMYGRSQEVPSAFGWLGNGIRRLERESKALVVSAIGTTMRNMMGTGVGLGFDAAKRLVESSIYAAGKTTKGMWDIAVNGKSYERGAVSQGLSDIVKDSFNTLTYLTNGGITAEVTDAILKHNPRIQQQIFHALQETGTQELSAISRFANTMNVAQDVMFRRAIFTASIERQMRRAGMDMYEVLAQNKRIPSDVIKNAADEALMGTFSFMPKKGIANNFVRFFEAPGMSLINPFPRFMTNAIAFQMKYNPIVGGARAASDAAQALLQKGKDPAMAERLGRRAVERLSEATIGGAAILAAYQYRSENTDIAPWELRNEDGSVVDTRAIFPIGPYMVMGELLRNVTSGRFSEVKVKESLETLAGMKLPGGTQYTLLENLPELAEGVLNAFEGKEAEKAQIAVGRFVGDFFTRFIQPLQPVNAFIETFDKEMQIARDPNVITSEDLVTEAMMNRVKAKFPIEGLPEGMVEPLPEAVSYFREGPPIRGGEFFNTLTGLRARPAANKIEKEVTELNIDPYTFFPGSGIKQLDREVIKKALPFIEELVVERIDSEEYKDMSVYQKRIMFRELMREAIQYGREEATGELFDTPEQEMQYHKMVFNRLPADQRRVINAAYAAETGSTIEADNAYDQHYDYLGAVEELK